MLKLGFLFDTGATTETATDAKFNRVITLLKAALVNDQVCRSLFPDPGQQRIPTFVKTRSGNPLPRA